MNTSLPKGLFSIPNGVDITTANGMFKDNNFADYIEVKNIEEAVRLAKEKSESGDAVLFSPGFASFGMFLNEYDRGEKYVQGINNL